MKRNKLIWFYIFTIILTVVLGGAGGALFDETNPTHYAIILAMAQSAPAFGLLLVCAFGRDWDAFGEMKWCVPFKKIIWIFAAAIIPVVFIGGSALILSVTGTPFVKSAFGAAEAISVAITASVIGAAGEEIGWRGFMLPVLHKKHNLLISAATTGFLWGLWHFGKIQLFGIAGYLLFTLLCVEFTVLMAWIFKKAGNSLIPMIVFHAMINISSLSFLNEREGFAFYAAACIIGGVLCGIVILADKTAFFSRVEEEHNA